MRHLIPKATHRRTDEPWEVRGGGAERRQAEKKGGWREEIRFSGGEREGRAMRGLGVRQGDGLRPREQTGVVYIFNMRLRSIQRFNFLAAAHIYKLGLEINPKGWHLQTTWAGQYVDVAPRTPNKRSA